MLPHNRTYYCETHQPCSNLAGRHHLCLHRLIVFSPEKYHDVGVFRIIKFFEDDLLLKTVDQKKIKRFQFPVAKNKTC